MNIVTTGTQHPDQSHENPPDLNRMRAVGHFADVVPGSKTILPRESTRYAEQLNATRW